MNNNEFGKLREKFCKHGTNIWSEKCLFCELQTQIDFLTVRSNVLSMRIDKFFEDHATLINDKNIHSRLDELNAVLKTCKNSTNGCMEKYVNNFDERLKQLDNKIDHYHTSEFKNNQSWMWELEKRIKEIEKSISNKPYKCPVCDGRRTHVSYEINKPDDCGLVHTDCICCEGKGIVWG